MKGKEVGKRTAGDLLLWRKEKKKSELQRKKTSPYEAHGACVCAYGREENRSTKRGRKLIGWKKSKAQMKAFNIPRKPCLPSSSPEMSMKLMAQQESLLQSMC